ncbi:MAG: DUF1343 domain-containing protein [Brachybacterium paraconglomeratum]|nr:DUF1343 domain-containing protein [Brachybacterium paraconglomeratum]
MNPAPSPHPAAQPARPGRRRVLASLGALPAGAVLAGAASAQAAPSRGKRVDGDFRLGVENLLEPAALETLRDQRVGLITNPTGADRALRSTIDLLVEAQGAGGFTMTALFGPEHGVRGAEPAGGAVGDYIDEKTGLPVRSLYGATQKPTPEMLADVDVLVFDIQDIGARFYTYIWTLYYAMQAAGENDKRFVVLDRPNPLGTDIEGFVLEPEMSSVVGLRTIPQTRGLPVGEPARLFTSGFLRGEVILEVVEMSGYDPEAPPVQELPWVLPSPNIPTPDTAVVYAGTGLIESLNISEGRGTTTPFLWFGAPFITEAQVDQIMETLRAAELPGVLYRPMFATPTTSKHAGVFCGGLQLHVTDAAAYEPVRTGIHVIAALLRTVEEVDWREGEDCRTEDDVCWIDKLTGTKRTRQMLEDGESPEAIVAAWRREARRFEVTTKRYRLY